jgi:hypothetical protein
MSTNSVEAGQLKASLRVRRIVAVLRDIVEDLPRWDLARLR